MLSQKSGLPPETRGGGWGGNVSTDRLKQPFKRLNCYSLNEAIIDVQHVNSNKRAAHNPAPKQLNMRAGVIVSQLG